MLKAAEGADRLPTGILALPRSGTETLPAQIIGIVDPLSVPSQGAFPRPDGSTEWCIWAPHHQKVSLVLWEHAEKSTHVMMRDEAGYFRWSGPGGHGQLYAYRIGDAAREYPDPVSRWQPKGVHRASAVFDPRASRGRTRAGAAWRPRRCRSTSCTSVRSRRQAPSPPWPSDCPSCASSALRPSN